MNFVLTKVRELFVFADDILIVTKGTKSELSNKAREILKEERIGSTSTSDKLSSTKMKELK